MALQYPTVYEYYSSGGISSGLSADQPQFTLNKKNISIYSGAMHYFRVPRAYWRDRLRKMRAAGLNTVETYVPWNLHEPQPGWFDFGAGGSDFQDLLHVEEFLRIAQEEDLLAIVRPGPYICSEWDFGGLPSWLLREKNIRVRSSDSTFMGHVARYFAALLPLLALLQFTSGGPIVAFQVENEYGSLLAYTGIVQDTRYLEHLHDLFRGHGIVELLVTSDGIGLAQLTGTLPRAFLQTANFQSSGDELDLLRRLQPHRPRMVMELWVGWFNHWGDADKARLSADQVGQALKTVLRRNASVNFYMFHGGTSFGFMNGANGNGAGYAPDITSYDYDAPLTERGEYTLKYLVIKNMLGRFSPVKLRWHNIGPDATSAVAYGPVKIEHQLTLYEVIGKATVHQLSSAPLPMELLSVNNMSGQSYGYVAYRKQHLNITAHTELVIRGRVRDTVMVMINGELVSKPLRTARDLEGFGCWKREDSSLLLADVDLEDVTLDLVVENWGRVNFGALRDFQQFKGLWDNVYLNDTKLYGWKIVPLEFKKEWTAGLSRWRPYWEPTHPRPALWKATLNIRDGPPQDTYLDMRNWTKGIVIVNGFVLGRYARIGPQHTLYLPAPLLQENANEIIIFEHFAADTEVRFSQEAIVGRQLVAKELARVGAKIQPAALHNGSRNYWTIGIGVFIVNNVVMAFLYFMVRRRR